MAMFDFFAFIFPIFFLIFFIGFIFTFITIAKSAGATSSRIRRVIDNEIDRHESHDNPVIRECRYCKSQVKDAHATHCPQCGSQMPFER